MVGIAGCKQPAKGNGSGSGAVTPVTPTKYTVTVPATIEHGSLTVSPALPADNQVAKDTELTFTATPTDATYEVDKWTITGGTFTEGGTSGSTTAKVKVTGNISVSVTFKAKVIPPTKYTVTVPATIEHGSLTVSPALPTDKQVAKDTELTFTATPTDATYEVDKWTITGVTVTEGGTPGSTTAKVKVTGNISVSVTFKAKVIPPTKYTVTFSVDGGNGSMSASVDGTGISSGDAIEKGKTVLFTAKPAAGYKVAGWTLDGAPVTDTNPSYSVTVEKNVEVKVRFIKGPEAVSVDIGGGKTLEAVKIPGATIPGAEHDAAANGNLPGTENFWKGVFIAGRNVTLSEYVMAKTEVPYWLWKEVYDWATSNGYTFANPGRKGSKGDGSGSEDEPVTMVSWRDCIVWCNAFTEMVKGDTADCVYLIGAGGTALKDATAKTDGTNSDCDKAYFDQNKKGFRLPTEAEWEYAARRKTGGTLLPLNYLSGATANYGDEAACKDVAWCKENSSDKTHEVGTRAANALGLYDMSGNVWEWCWDWYDDNAAAGDGGVASVSDPFGAGGGESRVTRGGCWVYSAWSCITGNRNKDRPGAGYVNLGFRLAWYK